jgi:flagellin
MIAPIATSPFMLAQRMLNRNQGDLFQATTRLATGRRINSGKDDPAGLISSERLEAELKALEAQSRTLERTDSFATITDGHIGELSGLMTELNGLVVAGANEAGLTDGEREAYQMQIDNVVASIQRVRGATDASLDEFNMPDGGNDTVKALVGSAAAAVQSVTTGGANSLASGNYEDAQLAVQSAITDVTAARGHVGSFQKNHVLPTIRSNQVAIENLAAGRSRVADTDFAVETSNLARAEVLVAANLMTLRVAQQQARSVLSLLRG